MAKPSKRYLTSDMFKPKGTVFEGLIWKQPNSKGTDTYDVECTEKGFTCECAGFTFRGKCKHSQDVLTRIEQALDDRSPKYCWEFGR
jgi:hypothetical protein